MSHRIHKTTEHQRLQLSAQRLADWKAWGPYVSERSWGTVREDYSATGAAWEYFPHDHARSRAYRWNEDGLGGVCNRFQNVCLAVALWNEQDAILKERLFGLSGNEGNHGEDVKEYYYYLDSTPTHSYMKMLYKYPQVAFPYSELVTANRAAGRQQPEVELCDLIGDALTAGRYFDVLIEYAKADQEDIFCRITAINRGPDPAPIHILPHIWFRNTWSWGYNRPKPQLSARATGGVRVEHRRLGERWWYVQDEQAAAGSLYFTENETNYRRLFGAENASPYVKDGIHERVVHGRVAAVNPQQVGTKAAAHFRAQVAPGDAYTVLVRFCPQAQQKPFAEADAVFAQRQSEANEFYDALHPPSLSEDDRRIQRQAFAGLMWCKQFYHYSVELWLQGDPTGPQPPPARLQGRNRHWTNIYNMDVLSMPDKWEYPWYAAWDLAFHTIPIAMIDPEWAKRQLILLLREWYMHPNGQIPAYEWALGDVNPPVHAWAAWQVYKIDREMNGRADTLFLERVFHKLLLNFTWWVNREDDDDNNVFQGGFLGLDNIGVFDRSQTLPTGGHIDQADGTAWMAMYCLNMLTIALELARSNPAYEDVATKFFEHFIYIAHAVNHLGGGGQGLWNDEDGFYYDVLHIGQKYLPFKIRSFVGLIPLFATALVDEELLEQLPRLRRRVAWFLTYRSDLIENVASLTTPGENGGYLLSLVSQQQLQRVVRRMLDEDAFLSPYGLRSLSKEHQAHPYVLQVQGHTLKVAYEPAESSSGLFGGNSNWRGPIWYPVNYLMVESLKLMAAFYGSRLQVELPTGSGRLVTLDTVADELSQRLIDLFRLDEAGHRPVFGRNKLFQNQPQWRDHLLFYEYFHGDTGRGVGASHQTGWTALVACLLGTESG
ncbi:MAG: glucosidase [Chloroflexi bacterium]|nr:glucosidase [Chloroflexota bacterium]